ncbi:MAG: hypothetical protein VST69_00875 [Nitrospirota bacterium]|nr:hypothetical protein [Nitrospirota bacterium]
MIENIAETPNTLDARKNIQDILHHVFAYSPPQKALIIYDMQSELSRLLTNAYRAQLPEITCLDFEQCPPETILEALNKLKASDLAILIQSTSFRLSKFRIRIELFQRKIKVIEHPHLGRMHKMELQTYIDSLAYDPDYYRHLGPKLKQQIGSASEIKLIGDQTLLQYKGPFLTPKLNIGDYSEMKNIGGQFPIGEVFTEPENLETLNGSVTLFAFGNTQFGVHVPEQAFTAIIEKGILVDSPNAPKDFLTVLNEIREKEEVVWVRELGFGLNRAFSQKRRVSDIGTYERMCGIHLSLGSKHLQYKKEHFRKKGGFHVDVFAKTKCVEIDGLPIYKNGAYL